MLVSQVYAVAHDPTGEFDYHIQYQVQLLFMAVAVAVAPMEVGKHLVKVVVVLVAQVEVSLMPQVVVVEPLGQMLLQTEDLAVADQQEPEQVPLKEETDQRVS